MYPEAANSAPPRPPIGATFEPAHDSAACLGGNRTVMPAAQFGNRPPPVCATDGQRRALRRIDPIDVVVLDDRNIRLVNANAMLHFSAFGSELARRRDRQDVIITRQWRRREHWRICAPRDLVKAIQSIDRLVVTLFEFLDRSRWQHAADGGTDFGPRTQRIDNQPGDPESRRILPPVVGNL